MIENYFENYVNEKVRTGKYASVSEIVRTALRLLEAEEQKAKTLTLKFSGSQPTPANGNRVVLDVNTGKIRKISYYYLRNIHHDDYDQKGREMGRLIMSGFKTK